MHVDIFFVGCMFDADNVDGEAHWLCVLSQVWRLEGYGKGPSVWAGALDVGWALSTDGGECRRFVESLGSTRAQSALVRLDLEGSFRVGR